ncbi:MAG TPA: ABC transporter substrate-binding protein, partial [Dehalococcoidia bacterium]|nr:ABC transporter substrate-binding protein [Dehalococcoidia bacterium]
MAAQNGNWQRNTPGRLNRRGILRGATFGGAGLALAAAGCGRSPSAPKSTGGSAGDKPQTGGTLKRRTVTTAFNGGFDPHIQQGSQTGEMGFFYQGALRLNPKTLAIEAEIAQKWEQPSQTEYLLHLNPAVKWQNRPPANGRPVTADDVVFSFERLRTNNPQFINRGLFDNVDKIQAVDKATVRLTTKAVDATTLNNLCAMSAKILAPEVVEKAGKFAEASSAVGTGAFMVQSRDDTGAVLVRNPDYWKPGLPYLDGIQDRIFKDDESAWAAFIVGQLDTRDIPGTEAPKVFAEQASKYHLEWFKDVGFVATQANTKKKPFDDPRVTKALRQLVDHDEADKAWAVTYFGRGYLSAYLPAALDSWDLTEQEYRSYLEFKTPKDAAVKDSLSLLAAAGYTKDNPLKFVLSGQVTDLSFSRAQTELMHAQFTQLSQGVLKPELRILDQAHMRDSLARRDFEYVITNLVADQAYEIDSWFRTFNYTDGSRNYGLWSDPKLDQMVDKQRTVF